MLRRLNYSQFRDDKADPAYRCKGQCATLQYLRLAPRRVGHCHNHPFGSRHRSIAPPIPGSIFPGIVQFASWPRSSNSKPPRMVKSRSAAPDQSKREAAVNTRGSRNCADKAAARRRRRSEGSSSSIPGTGIMPDNAVLGLEIDLHSGRQIFGNQCWQPDPKIDEISRPSTQSHTFRDQSFIVHQFIPLR